MTSLQKLQTEADDLTSEVLRKAFSQSARDASSQARVAGSSSPRDPMSSERYGTEDPQKFMDYAKGHKPAGVMRDNDFAGKLKTHLENNGAKITNAGGGAQNYSHENHQFTFIPRGDQTQIQHRPQPG